VSKVGVGSWGCLSGLGVAVTEGVGVCVATLLAPADDVAVAGAEIGVGGTESWHPIPRIRLKMRR